MWFVGPSSPENSDVADKAGVRQVEKKCIFVYTHRTFKQLNTWILEYV